MNNTKYNQLREEIIKAVPSIIRLEFGCDIKFRKEINGKYINGKFLKVLKYSNPAVMSNEGEYRGEIPMNWIKIIGRDISLEDCLIAMHWKSQFYIIDTSGQFIERAKGDDRIYEETNIWWSRNKPLQDQGEETIEFLWDLICK